MVKPRKIGILTGGGDCPGLNNAIKQVVETADSRGIEVEGLTEGWKGPILAALKKLPTRTVTYPLDLKEVRRIDREGGSILMSSRKNPFNYKGEDVSDAVAKFLSQRYYALIAIGGEDTLGIAGKLAKKGLRVIGIPKTIDKDLCGTDTSLGFDSALNYDTETLKRLRSTAGSHGMIYFVEIMGRHAGHLAYRSAAASHTHFLTIPEVEISSDKLFEKIFERKSSLKMKRGYTRDGLRYSIIAVAEGTRLKGIGEIVLGERDPSGNVYLGGIAQYLATQFKERFNKEEYETRAVVIGHSQRGGTPSTQDNLFGMFLGTKAIELVEKEQFGRMASIRGNEISDVSLDVVIDRIRILDAQVCYDTVNFKPILKDNLYREREVGKRR